MPGKDYSGLEAEFYDLLRGGDELDEIGFYLDVAAEKGGRCLDLGCGTGRVMIPLAHGGVDVTGVDASPAMVEKCRARLAEEELSCEVLEGDATALDLGREFDLIVVPGATFQLLDERAWASVALERMRAHLAPGGLLVMSLFTPWYEITHELLDGVWRLEKDEPTGEGGERALCHAAADLDRCEQLMEVRHRFERIDAGGKTIDSEIRTTRLRWYGKHEIELMLRAAGLEGVETIGEFGDEEAGDGHCAIAVFASAP